MPLTTALLADHPNQLPTVVNWIFREWGIRKPGNTIESVTARLRPYLQRSELPIMIVAFDADECVGCASLRAGELPGRAWLATVYVPENHRRRGIGATLVRSAEIHAASIGFAELYLCTPDRHEFYSVLGWEFFEPGHRISAPGKIMRKQLT